MNNSKIIFFPKNDKKDATGKVPIYCKITVNGTRTTFPTKKYVDPKKWDANKQFRLSRELSEKEIRNYLDNIKRDIERIEEKFQEQGIRQRNLHIIVGLHNRVNLIIHFK